MLEQSINLSQQKSLYLLTGGSKLPFNLAHNFVNVLTECILIRCNLAAFEKAHSATPRWEVCVTGLELWHAGWGKMGGIQRGPEETNASGRRKAVVF